ncbi:MAG: radical SAM family heme chaperone HemW [Gammaproteobacteria bacterium]|nr:radical SAM family heme chaperone HemW [Gammaproteobacteria bacterium]
MQADIAHYGGSRPIHSIFIGGGTPSLFSPRGMIKLMEMVRRVVDLEPDAEVTLEANPGTVQDSAERFTAYRQAGINRLSLGAQSFDNQRLEDLGRIHRSEQIGEAFRAARAAGIRRINIDIMHGLPGQTAAAAIDDLAQATRLGPEHISWYQLTIEPNTVFYRNPPVLPDEDVLAGIQDRGLSFLAERGFDRYEVSAFATPGEQSRHNLNYWRFGDYLGIGAGAHGKITHPDRIERTRKTRSTPGLSDFPKSESSGDSSRMNYRSSS